MSTYFSKHFEEDETKYKKLTRISEHSYTVNIPKQIIKKYGWKEKQKLSIVDRGRGKIEIRDWKRR